MYDDYGTIFSDAAMLLNFSFTHINHVSLTRARLDHCLSSKTFHNSSSEVCVKYECQGSNHLPLVLSMNFGAHPISVISEEPADRLKWEFFNQWVGCKYAETSF